MRGLRHPRRAYRSDRGSAAVELALVVPVVLLIGFGLVDVGRVLNAQIKLTEAAREGARAASNGQSASTRVAAVTQGMSGVTTNTVNCSTYAAPGTEATVTTTHTITFVSPLSTLAGMFGGSASGTATLTGRGVMPCRT